MQPVAESKSPLAAPSKEGPCSYAFAALFTLIGAYAGWRYWRHDPVAIWLNGVAALLIGYYIGGRVDWGIDALTVLNPGSLRRAWNGEPTG